MTVAEAISRLQSIQKKHGDSVPVYFDCPKCGESFTPGIVVTVAMFKSESEIQRTEPTTEGQ